MNKPTTTVYAEPVVATPVVQQQPGATPAATLVTNGSSNYVYVPPKDVFASSTGPNEWKHNICDCCTNANCCCVAMNILFPHVADMCFYSNAVAASGVDPDRIFSNNETLRTNQQCRACLVCCAMCCEVVPCQGLFVLTVLRLHVAHKYQIKEDCMHALCCSCFCMFCSMCQVQNEILSQENLRYGCNGLCTVEPKDIQSLNDGVLEP